MSHPNKIVSNFHYSQTTRKLERKLPGKKKFVPFEDFTTYIDMVSLWPHQKLQVITVGDLGINYLVHNIKVSMKLNLACSPVEDLGTKVNHIADI